MRRRLDDVRSGSGVYLLALVDALREAGFRVRIVLAPVSAFGSLPVSRPADSFAARGCEIVWPGTLAVGRVRLALRAQVWRRTLTRALAELRWVLRGRRGPRPAHPSDLSLLPSDADAAALAAAADAVPSRLVVAEYSSLAPCLARCAKEAGAVLLHDLLSMRSRSFQAAGLAPDHGEVAAATEIEWLAPADICIYASACERAAFAPRLPGKTHVAFPPPIRARGEGAAVGGAPRAVFIGVRHGGNCDALDAILREVWPRTRAACPEAELWIVGEIGEDMAAPHPPGVRVTGRLDDLGPVGGPDAVGLAPARAASGVSIKIATYLELGMAALATRTALEGFGDSLGGAVRAVPDIDAFADALIDLLSDPEARHALAGRGAARAGGPQHGALPRLLADLARAPSGPTATASPAPPTRPASGR